MPSDIESGYAPVVMMAKCETLANAPAGIVDD